MSAAYAGLIDRRCPSGSLRLLGFSFGGVLAMEVARLLEEKGRRVAFVALIEFEPQWCSQTADRLPMLSAIAVELSQRLRTESPALLSAPREAIEHGLVKAMDAVIAKGPAATASALTDWLVKSGFVSQGSRGKALTEYLMRIATHAGLGHSIDRIDPVNAPLYVWKATQGLLSDDTQWETLSRAGVELRSLEGNHFDAIATPNCVVIANVLRELHGSEGELLAHG
jgi:thioesterase domain-containing protein